MNINMKSDCIYINKAIYNKAMDVSVMHIVDEDCNEFMAVMFGCYMPKQYVETETFKNVTMKPYDDEEWRKIEDKLDYLT